MAKKQIGSKPIIDGLKKLFRSMVSFSTVVKELALWWGGGGIFQVE
jgi:hypothetical protein